MSDGKSFDDVIYAIHEAIGKAECLLPELGDGLRFLVGPQGEIEIVRRDRKGGTFRPKIVVAELTGCDPMLWRPDHPAWMDVLEQRRIAAPPKEGNGQPADEDEDKPGGEEKPGDEDKPEDGGSEPPVSH